MKAKLFLFAAFVALVLTACDNYRTCVSPQKVLIGYWQVVKETMTNGDGFGGVVTHTEDFHWGVDSYHFYEKSVLIWNSHAYYFAELTPFPYSLTEQKDGTWLITVPEMYDKQPNLEGGLSPITIHKLTSNTMEWQFEAYGGDEGPVVFYQYLKKISENPQ